MNPEALLAIFGGMVGMLIVATLLAVVFRWFTGGEG